MPSSEFSYTPEGVQAEFRKGIETAQRALGDDVENSLIPPSITEEEILAMSLEEIQSKFARRYEMFVQILEQEYLPEKVEGGGDFKLDLDEFKKWLVALNSLDTYIQKHYSGEENVLREKQVPIFESFRNFLEAGGKKGYVKLPTGLGKTVLFSELVEALDLRALIIVPTKLLIRQTHDKFTEFAEDLDVGRIYTSAKEYGRQVTITTYNSFVSQVNKGLLDPKDFDCVILDEVHLGLTDKKQTALHKFNDCIQIGFTATPEYSQDKKVGDFFVNEIHSMNIKEAVEEGLLSSFSALVAKTDVDISQVEFTSSGDYDMDQLEKAVNVAGRNQSAVDLYKRVFMGELGVAYCVGIRHAQVVAETFNRQGIPAAMISGEMEDKEQENLLKDFHSGKIKVLCNADILIAGFNEERASVCFNLRPTRSKVVAEQRGGRVLRLDKENPNKHAYVIDFIDKGIKLKRAPVLFSHVAGAAEITQKQKRETFTGGGGGGRKRLPPILDIPGLEVVTDIEEVMKIVNEHREDKKISLEELKIEVKMLKINRAKDYFKIVRSKPSWPSKPHIFYKNQGWISWPNLFGTDVERKGKAEKLTLDGLKAEVHALKIRNRESYHLTAQKKPSWPASPDKFYKDSGWVSWVDFLPTPTFSEDETTKKFDLNQLKAEVLSLGVNSQREYKIIVKTKPKWPSNPHVTFKGKGWISWEDLCGKEKVAQKEKSEKLSLEQLKSEVQALNIKNIDDYRRFSKEHPTWPFHPDKFYIGKGWISWLDLLARKKISFEDLKREVRAAGINKQREYEQVCKSKPDWPSDPARFYPNWVSWPDFWGK